MLHPSFSYSPRLKREQIKRGKWHIEHHDEVDDEADFQAARREDSLAIEALDALGFVPNGLSAASSKMDLEMGHGNDVLPATKYDCLLSPLTPQREEKSDAVKVKSCVKQQVFNTSGMVRRHRSEMPSNTDSFEDAKMALLKRSESLVRKSGVFEFPCDPGMALSDLCVILALKYDASTIGENDYEVQTRISYRMKQMTIVVKVEDRRSCSRLSLSPSLEDGITIGDDFDSFCTELFFSLLNVRQVIRPYYK